MFGLFLIQSVHRVRRRVQMPFTDPKKIAGLALRRHCTDPNTLPGPAGSFELVFVWVLPPTWFPWFGLVSFLLGIFRLFCFIFRLTESNLTSHTAPPATRRATQHDRENLFNNFSSDQYRGRGIPKGSNFRFIFILVDLYSYIHLCNAKYKNYGRSCRFHLPARPLVNPGMLSIDPAHPWQNLNKFSPHVAPQVATRSRHIYIYIYICLYIYIYGTKRLSPVRGFYLKCPSARSRKSCVGTFEHAEQLKKIDFACQEWSFWARARRGFISFPHIIR